MLRRVAPALLLALLFAASEASAASTLAIALREELATDRLEYTLGEIATLRSADAALVGRLRALRIGRSPRAGYANAVTRAAVEAQLERAVPGLHRRTRWSGPAATRVRAVGHALPLDGYVEGAREHLDAWLDAVSSQHTVRLVEPVESVRLPTGRIDVTPRMAAGAALRSRMCVWLDFSIEGKPYTSAPVWFEVTAFREVLTTTRDLSPGMALSAGDVAPRRVDLAAAPGSPLPGLALAPGQRVRRFVPAGALLPGDAIEPIPAVAQGEEIVVVAESGRVRIETTAVALQDGQQGESIRVRPPHGDARYRVLVTGPRHATVGGGDD